MAVDTSSVRNKVARIIGGANAGNNFGGSFTADYSNGPRNGLIDFTMSSGSGSITSVKLFMYMNNAYGGTGNVDCHQLSRVWLQAQVTWNSYTTGNAWTSPGGDYGATISTTSVTTTPGWFSWDITSLGLTWGNDVNLILVANANSQCDYDVTTNLPYIEITYTAGAAANGNMLAVM